MGLCVSFQWHTNKSRIWSGCYDTDWRALLLRCSICALFANIRFHFGAVNGTSGMKEGKRTSVSPWPMWQLYNNISFRCVCVCVCLWLLCLFVCLFACYGHSFDFTIIITGIAIIISISCCSFLPGANGWHSHKFPSMSHEWRAKWIHDRCACVLHRDDMLDECECECECVSQSVLV